MNHTNPGFTFRDGTWSTFSGIAFRQGAHLVFPLAKGSTLFIAILFSLALSSVGARSDSGIVHTSTIKFAAGDNTLDSNARVTLDGVASRLLGNTNRAKITGYADEALGAERDDRRLSLRRAIAVRNYLMDKGATEQRLKVYARGDAGTNGVGVRIDLLPPS